MRGVSCQGLKVRFAIAAGLEGSVVLPEGVVLGSLDVGMFSGLEI